MSNSNAKNFSFNVRAEELYAKSLIKKPLKGLP